MANGMNIYLPERTKLGSCELRCVLGHGGGGISYLALDTVLKRPVVIKEHFPMGLCLRIKGQAEVIPLNEEAYAASLATFCCEARLLAGLNHDNVVRVHDIFEALGTAYIIMEYAEGETLREWLPAHGSDCEAVEHLLRQLLLTLDYLHTNCILHRDIKPSNIVVKEDGRPMLLDFGSAHMGTVAHTHTAVGSPGYAAPEQFSPHGHPGPSADLYGLAQSFLHLLTEQQRQLYPRRFMSPLLQATLTDPAKRPQSAEAWLKMLDKRGFSLRRWGVVAAAVAAMITAAAFFLPSGDNRTQDAAGKAADAEYETRIQAEAERYAQQLESLQKRANATLMSRDEHQRRQEELQDTYRRNVEDIRESFGR